MADYYLLPEKEVLAKLQSSSQGLSSVEAQERLKVYGPNHIREIPPESPFWIFVDQFKSPMMWILIVAMLVALVAREFVDVGVIGVIVVLNAVLGFAQEYRAERAIEALKKMISLKAVVLRDGAMKEVDASDVVPGDILVVNTGSKVAADARLLEAVNAKTQEASLTGESMPVRKAVESISKEVAIGDRHNMLFAGTLVIDGHAKAVVVGTGMQTEMGKIAALIQEAAPSETPLQQQLSRLSVNIGIGVVCLAVVIFVVGVLRTDQPATVWLLTAIALAVAAIPEGLPAVVTVGLSVGVQRMARKNALVRYLPSAETLGACTVICSDKTGTLTKNEMTVRKLYVNRQVVEIAGVGYSPEGYFSKDANEFELLLRIGALNNDSELHLENGLWQVVGDPTEASLLVSAKKGKLDVEKLHDDFPRKDELEFTSERKRMTTVHVVKGKRVAYTKGAPDILLDLCSKILVNGRVERLTRQEKSKILAQNEAFARNALRVLGFAFKELVSKDGKNSYENDLVFVGLQAMIDPPRLEVKDAIARCESAGIKVVMITGDHAVTAQAVARELGIEGKAVTGMELDKINLEQEVDGIAVYARVNPEHKLKIVDALKKRGHIVAMTGDGVNDAPALKKADIGIAMGLSGTDVAKEASAMILADDNFTSIVRAVEEGRRIYDNIQKYVAYLFAGNIGEVLVIVGSVLLGMPLPLLAIQILWVNLVTDGLPALALSVDPLEIDAMARPPRHPRDSIFRGIGQYVTVYPLILTIGTLWLFDYFQLQGMAKAQTIAFTSLVFFQLFQGVSVRSVRRSVFSAGLFANRYLWLAVLSSAALQVFIVSTPFLQGIFKVTSLSLVEWGVVVLFSLSGFAYLEVHKVFARQ
ncbi:calcium-translocating P-type ATPase, SERCA-type [Candidatus Woesearchaeota archaeon]|nr:calcium-translocating P-type ATPase, SERCA-type [Candidatus Woesearchaeota archaeon]